MTSLTFTEQIPSEWLRSIPTAPEIWLSSPLSCDADATQTHMAEMDRLDLAVLGGGGAQLAATERANVDRVRDALG